MAKKKSHVLGDRCERDTFLYDNVPKLIAKRDYQDS